MGTSRKVNADVYEIYMQTEPIPFGKYPKAKYELWMGQWMFYWFTTTCRSPDECIKLMIEKGRNSASQKKHKFYIYETVNGKRGIVHNENTQPLLHNIMDVSETKGQFKKAIW